MKSWMKRTLLIIIVGITIYCGYIIYIAYSEYNNEDSKVYNEDTWVNPLDNIGIIDNKEVYTYDNQKQVDKIYLTIPRDKKNKYQDFQQFINSKDNDSNSKTTMKVYFQHGQSRELRLFEEEPNATLQIRGNSYNKTQKSFKIELYDKTGLWNNQKIINLNKDYNDPLRIRNKLSFDYFQIIPNITSFRTRFVRLYVKDKSSSKNSNEFEDFGLYTHIEQPNKLFLKNHLLDPNGHLYKAENFKFLTYENQIKNKKDADYSKEAFESILEIRGNNDHNKLIEMLQAVNDMNRDINEVVDIYFHKENYLTWVACNILFDNYKTNKSNFLLYSPINSTKWYFMPWDYDKAWGIDVKRPMWKQGLSMYWDNKLHQRFFSKKENVEALSHKIEELSKIITKNQTKKFIDGYYNILLLNITKLPDLMYLPITINELKYQLDKLQHITELNKNYYKKLIENPMPYNLHEPQYIQKKWIFTWDNSYDIQGDTVTYNYEISKDKNFNNIYMTINNITDNKCEINKLNRGVYYWRVKATDNKSNSQIAYNIYKDEFGEKYYGIKKLVVNN